MVEAFAPLPRHVMRSRRFMVVPAAGALVHPKLAAAVKKRLREQYHTLEQCRFIAQAEKPGHRIYHASQLIYHQRRRRAEGGFGRLANGAGKWRSMFPHGR
jgi:hypothetical protein